MNIKSVFQVSALASALVLAGCGGDIKIQPTVNNVNSNNVTGGGTVTDTNPCATRGTVQGAFDGKHCEYSRTFASANVEFTEDLNIPALPNGGVHVFEGALLIGEDCLTTTACTIDTDGPTLSIEAGATLAFTSGEGMIRIGRGAKIDAVGTMENPITFTSVNEFSDLNFGIEPQFGDWGGIIINGFGKTNKCTDIARTDSTCNAKSEGITSYYGGNNNEDDSGTIQYAKIFYAGSGPKVGGAGDDLNSLTLNAVGSGSSFDYLHIHQGYDDGIEFFGGAANISHIVVTENQDDAIDIDGGWVGNGQFIFVQHGSTTTTKDVFIPAELDDDGVTVVTPSRTIDAGSSIFLGNNGFETDGQSNKTFDDVAYDDVPSSNPTISNVTIITTDEDSVRDGDPSQAFKFDDAIKSQYSNVLIVKSDSTNGTACIEHKGDGEFHIDEVTFAGSVMACESEFKGDDVNFGSGPLNGTAKTEWFDNSGASVRIAHNSTVLSADGFSTDVDSADLVGMVTPIDPTTLGSFFLAGTYVGAVSENDTSSDWYEWVEAAVAVANND